MQEKKRSWARSSEAIAALILTPPPPTWAPVQRQARLFLPRRVPPGLHAGEEEVLGPLLRGDRRANPHPAAADVGTCSATGEVIPPSPCTPGPSCRRRRGPGPAPPRRSPR